MCAYAFNCCWLLCVLSLFSFRLTLAPPPSLCRSPSPTRQPFFRIARLWNTPFCGSCLPLDCADLPLIALPCLVCLASQKKKGKRETQPRARFLVAPLTRRRLHPFPFSVSDHTSLSTGCVFLLASLKGLPNPDRLQLRKSWLPRQSYHTKGHPDLVTGIPLLFLKSVCGNLLICIPLLI